MGTEDSVQSTRSTMAELIGGIKKATSMRHRRGLMLMRRYDAPSVFN